MDSTLGLSHQEVLARRAAGQGNRVRYGTSRSYWQILRDNAFTFINTVLFAIGAALIAMGQVSNALVTAGLVLLNVVIGVMQEGRAKHKLDQIALLLRPKATTIRDGQERVIDPAEIVIGDVLIARAGDQIVVDGRLVGDSTIEVDESLLTGESDLVSKRTGDEVYSGSFCVIGSAAYAAVRVGAASYAGQITAGARAFRRIKTPLQRDIDYVIRVMVILAGTLGLLLALGGIVDGASAVQTVEIAAVVAVLVPQGLFFMTTMTYAAGAVRMAGSGALVQQANAIESMSNVDVLCMDKTGTLTTNRIMFHLAHAIDDGDKSHEALLGDVVASVSDRNRTAEAIAAAFPGQAQAVAQEVPFSSARKWSALTFSGPQRTGTYILGAVEMLERSLTLTEDVRSVIGEWSSQGLRVVLFAGSPEPAPLHNGTGEAQLPERLAPLAVLSFSDQLRPEAEATLREFAGIGVAMKIISGDNPQTVAALARQAGFDPQAEAVSGLDLARMSPEGFAAAAARSSIFGRITPQQKEALVKSLRAQGRYVAMIGDGVNDVLSLKQAQLGVAMHAGSQATRSVADLVLMDNSFAVLPAAFREGQRIVRGMQDVMRLHLSRTFYVTLLIVASSLVGLAFPISPKHNFILALLTVGIPTLTMVAWAKPAARGSRSTLGARPGSSLAIISHFVFPAALSVAMLGFAVYFLAAYFIDDLALARTALTTTTVLCGLVLIPFAEPPVPAFVGGDELSGDWRPTGVAALMLATFAAIMLVPSLRAFFELATLSLRDLALIGCVVAGWTILLRTIWRRRIFERLFEVAG